MFRMLVPGLIPALALVITMPGCKERDIPFVVDEDELIRYVTEAPEAKELFRTSGLINTDSSYTVPFDSGRYRDSLISRTREFHVYLVPLKIPRPGGSDSISTPDSLLYVDYGSLGRLREGLVKVVDKFLVETTREYNDTVLCDTTARVLTRYAFFLKLGHDGKPYVGWSLWGFNGIGLVPPPVNVTIERYDASTFRGDFSIYTSYPRSRSAAIPSVGYIRLSNIDTVVVGSRLVVSTARTAASTYQLISGYDKGGTFTRAMTRLDSANYVDTVRTSSSNPNYYNLLHFQSFADDHFSFTISWCAPYRR